uniref:chitin synthase n=4 Tax=Gasterosteus aculeatus TaxID=69293 RepID=A0AAQ4PNG5_GASAC|nr:chitin synthase chs-2-like [Gasterosteus aculeatus aculeatus]
MEDERNLPKRSWDACREVPPLEDERTPWKMLKLLKVLSLCVVAVLVFGLALCSKTSFLLLVTLSNEGTKTLPDGQKPVALLCIGCVLIASSLLLLLKSVWKACHKSSKMPDKRTVALVLFFEFLVAMGAAILTIVAMPHLDIVTNVTILNGVAVLSTLLQVITQCTAKQRNRFLVPSITAFLLILLGYVLFLLLYITKDPTDTRRNIWAGLAVGGSFLMSFNWWENYFKLISENRQTSEKSNPGFLEVLCIDVKECQNVLHILSSLLRIAVTAGVLGAYVPLDKMDWAIVTSIPSRETRIIGIIIGVQLISSALCHWFSLVACKMHAMRRCFILPLYLASLAAMVLFVVPVIVFHQNYRNSLNGTQSSNFRGYCNDVVDARNQSLSGNVFPDLVRDVTHTLCFLDLSRIYDIGLLTGSAACWCIGLVLATLHLWFLSLFRIQRTQDLFVRRLYEGAFIEQSLLLNTRFDIQTTEKQKQFKSLDPVKVFLCATMWHETPDEMMNILISIFRLDKYRPKKEGEAGDVTFEGHIFFDDAFTDVAGSRGAHVNQYAEMLVNIIAEVYSIFLNINNDLFTKKQQIPDQTIVATPYGGRLVVTMPHGNTLTVHYKNKKLIRHKKRWSQVMYLYYLLGWKVSTKYFKRWGKGEEDVEVKNEFEREKKNTYILALDGDTDFTPAAVMLLIDRLKLYPQVGAACGRIHPTGSGPVVWYQKFEYAVGHWLHKTAEHVFGCVFCSPGCFSLFRAEALMDDNVMKKYTAVSSQAQHYIQYDQGEDRWLCTLLLKQGWRVEYNAASDAHTNAPEDFKEFYNQRRRWGPSTMANMVDLLGCATVISKKNTSISKVYMLYQLISLVASILAPSTVILMIAGSLTVLLDVHQNVSLVLAVIPPAIFLGASFRIKADTQILVAAILSILYAFLMMVSAITIIGTMVKDQTILTPSSLFLIFLALFYVITALLHPQEIGLVFYGFIYIICIPSAYLLLSIYSMVNMNNVSWGTRETAPAARDQAASQTKAEKVRSTIARFFSRSKCCRRLCLTDAADERILSRDVPSEEPEPRPQNTIVEEAGRPEEQPRRSTTVAPPHQNWVAQLQSLSNDMNLSEDKLDEEEGQFFRELTSKYLQPVPEDKGKQEIMINKLRELRNKMTFVYFIINAFWLVVTFTLQLLDSSVFIRVPKINFDLEYTGEYIFIDPVGFMFILSFALLVVIQFFGMLYHRMSTLIHYVAFLSTEPMSTKQNHHQPIRKIVDGESEDFDDLSFQGDFRRRFNTGTLV